MNKKLLIENLTELIKPIIDNLNYELYYIEFVKENRENYLRIYIDNENGITLSDCEKVSRPISSMLDEVDLIQDSYYLEVSSPGINRLLYNDNHLAKNLGRAVSIHLNKDIENQKIIMGILKNFDENNINILYNEQELCISRKNILSISLYEVLFEED